MSWMSQVCGESENDYISVNKKYLNRLENDSKELEVYKKALELACWDTKCNCLHDDYYNDLLKKAREQN